MPPAVLLIGFAVAYCLATSTAYAAEAPAAGLKIARASIGINVRIPRVLSLQLLDHPPAFTVSAEDAKRGEVVVQGTRIEIHANDPAGFRLRGEVSGSQVAEVEITGLGAGFRVHEGESISVLMPRTDARPVARAVEYRFVLQPGTVAGRYEWPAVLRVEKR
jgi:hypothetical protein